MFRYEWLIGLRGGFVRVATQLIDITKLLIRADGKTQLTFPCRCGHALSSGRSGRSAPWGCPRAAHPCDRCSRHCRCCTMFKNPFAIRTIREIMQMWRDFFSGSKSDVMLARSCWHLCCVAYVYTHDERTCAISPLNTIISYTISTQGGTRINHTHAHTHLNTPLVGGCARMLARLTDGILCKCIKSNECVCVRENVSTCMRALIMFLVNCPLIYTIKRKYANTCSTRWGRCSNKPQIFKQQQPVAQGLNFAS